MMKIAVFVLALALAAGCSEPSRKKPGTFTPGDASQLIGTVWRVGDLTVTFKDAATIHVQGTPIAKEHPQGAEGTYAVNDGIVEAKVLDQIRVGTWDGTDLIVDGEVAARIKQ